VSELRTAVYAAIDVERAYQDAQWGTIKENPHRLYEWLRIAHEELHEAQEAHFRGEVGNTVPMRAEMLQTAAVLVAALEQYGVVPGHEEVAA
jgi:hypothetical protein